MLDDVLLWGPILLAGAALVLVSAYTPTGQAPTTGPDGDRTGAPLDSSLYLACHSLKCAHLARPHDVAESGRLVCRDCGRTATDR
ncbi:hypothetical protein [Streptomyces sp. NPDC002526]